MFSFLVFFDDFFTFASNNFESERFGCGVMFVFTIEDHDFAVWEIA